MSSTSQFNLYFVAKNLQDKDTFSKSDPRVKVYVRDPSLNDFALIGETETIKNNLNPEFKNSVRVEYYFSDYQEVKICVVDDDNQKSNNSNGDSLGIVETTMAELVKTNEHKFPLNKKGELYVRIEPIGNNRDIHRFVLAAKDLPKTDLFGSTDPLFRIYRSVIGDGKTLWKQVYQSEYLEKNKNPIWKEVVIKSTDLCAGDEYNKIRIVIFDHDKPESLEPVGIIETTVNTLKTKSNNVTIVNFKDNKLKVRKDSYEQDLNALVLDPLVTYKTSGTLLVNKWETQQGFAFTDYISNGMSIDFAVAIDFTGSNGHPNDQNSLHCKLSGENPYKTCLNSAAKVVTQYTNGRSFPVYGFGGIFGSNSNTDHKFKMGDCATTDDLLNLYNRQLDHVTLSGPTVFTPILEQVTKQALQNKDHAYTVLLLITDGANNDSSDFIQQLRLSVKSPLSVIIIGVGDGGNDNFQGMQVLDDLKVPQQVSRDIVQFVKYNDFSRNTAAFVRQALGELPSQVESFMKENGLRPSQFKKN